MNELLRETAHWPEVSRIQCIRAVMDKVYAIIHAENREAEIALHEAKYGKPRRH